MPASVYKPAGDYITDMIATGQQLGSAITDFHIGSGARNLYEVLATELSLQSLILDQLNQDSYIATASGQALDDKAADLLVFRKAAVQAAGTITVSVPVGASLPIHVPAGWSQLSTLPSTPADTPVAVITTQDIVATVAGNVTVTAIAVLGGAAGNLGAGTQLVPQTPVDGLPSLGGFAVGTGGFSGGVDVESDSDFRTRIPIAVQGRAKGNNAAYQAAALAVPGVSSANVLTAGQARGDGSTVPAGSIEVYYKGSAGVANQVQSALTNAAVSNAAVTAGRSNLPPAPAIADRLIANCVVTAKSGTDTSALASAVLTAILTTANAVPVGGTAYQGDVIQAIHAVPSVIAVNVPLTDFCRFGQNVATDIAEPGDTYPSLVAGDVTIAVQTI